MSRFILIYISIRFRARAAACVTSVACVTSAPALQDWLHPFSFFIIWKQTWTSIFFIYISREMLMISRAVAICGCYYDNCRLLTAASTVSVSEKNQNITVNHTRPLSPSSSSTIHARCSRVHVSCFNANSFAAYYYYYSKSLERWRTSCCPPFTKRKCVKWKLQNALTEFPLVVLHCKHLISSCPCVFTGCIVLTSWYRIVTDTQCKNPVSMRVCERSCSMHTSIRVVLVHWYMIASVLVDNFYSR